MSAEQKILSRRHNLWRVLAYARPWWKAYVFTVLMGLIKFLIPVAIAWLFGEAIDVLSQVQREALSSEAAWSKLKTLFGIGVAIALFGPVPTFLRAWIGAKVNWRVCRDIRCDLYAHIQKLSHSFFDRNRTGALTSRIISDVTTLSPFLGRTLIQLWMNLGMVIVILVYFFSQNFYLGLLSITLIPVQLIVLQTVGKRVKKVSRRIRGKLAYMSGNAQEVLAGATVVKAFTQEDDEVRRFTDEAETLVGLGVKNAVLNGITHASLGMLKVLAPLLVILLGGWLALFRAETLSLGLLVQFVLMQNQLYGPFERLSETQIVAANALGAVDRIFEILDTEPEIRDRPHAVQADRLRGQIDFAHVRFAYPQEGGHKILDDFNLRVPEGSCVALVGPSGGGKSTVVRLLLRFYDIQAGVISIDGRDIRDYRINSLRHSIGLVPQEPILFSGSVLENILYGRPDASIDEVYEAVENANALEFINNLPRGIKTHLGENGTNLSGGQRQRIAVARAFLKNPPILILDEATSALDSESEHKVQQALSTLIVGRTTLTIAHRLSTIVHADQIAVVEGGKVVEIGTHGELVQKGGLYTTLCRRQFDTVGA